MCLLYSAVAKAVGNGCELLQHWELCGPKPVSCLEEPRSFTPSILVFVSILFSAVPSMALAMALANRSRSRSPSLIPSLRTLQCEKAAMQCGTTSATPTALWT